MRFRIAQAGMILCLFSFILITACQKQKTAWQGTVEETDGVVVVKNPRMPLDSEMRIAFVEELSIGVEEGDENYMFGSEVLLNTDAEGNFYVTDWDKRIVNKYDREGRFLKSIGRRGQGPGEFQNISLPMNSSL